MELGEEIRARIGAEVLDQMLDDLVEGLVNMAREGAGGGRAAGPRGGAVQQSSRMTRPREVARGEKER
jgi:hypothetical protein